MPKISEAEYQARRAHLLSAAKHCFARFGIGASIDDACRTAGVSKGAFYGYFKSKDAIFEALAHQHGSTLGALVRPTNRTELIALLLELSSAAEPDFARFELDSLAYATRHPTLNGIFVENAQLFRWTVQSLLTGLTLNRAIDADRAVRLIESAMLAAFLSIALGGDSALGDARIRIAEAVDLVIAD